MKIALFNCLTRSVPPQKSGGIEKIINYLLRGLTKRGHKVTLFSTANSAVYPGSSLVSNYPTGIEDTAFSESEKLKLNLSMTKKLGDELVERQEQFDVIHNHCLDAGLPVLSMLKTKHFSTIHEFVNFNSTERLKPYKNELFTSISYSQRAVCPDLKFIANIYHGIDLSNYALDLKPDNYLAFVGRISQQKNPHLAIIAAAKLKRKLIIVGKYKDEALESDYYSKLFLPTLKKHAKYVEWIGEIDERDVIKILQKATACLLPVGFREPFGLAAVEAMAVGCPVIAYSRGAYKETIVHGKTGFLVEDLEEMVQKIKLVPEINRKDCRKHVEKNFTIDRMVGEYEKLYKRVAQDRKNFLPLFSSLKLRE